MMNYNDKIAFCISFIALNLFLGIVNFLRGNRFTAIVCLAMTALWSADLIVYICEYNKRRK